MDRRIIRAAGIHLREFMLRKFFNTAAGVLLAFSLFFAAMWIRSHWQADTVYRQASPMALSMSSNDGGLTLGRRVYVGLQLNSERWDFYSGPAFGFGYGVPRWSFAGFRRGELQGNMVGGSWTYQDDYYTAPYWFLLLGASVVPTIWLLRRYSERAARIRALHGRCAACGYDLRASSGRCPECGKTAPVVPSSGTSGEGEGVLIPSCATSAQFPTPAGEPRPTPASRRG